MRPLFARAVSEHEALAEEAGAAQYLRRTGWLKLYRSDRAFAALARELDLAKRFGIANVSLDRDCGAARSNRRWRRFFATPCIGPAR